MNPTGFHLDPAAMEAEAKLWDEQAVAAKRVGNTVDLLRFHGHEVGMFSSFVPRYHTLVDAVVNCTSQGERRMAELSRALLAILGNYEELDRRGAERIRGVGSARRQVGSR